MTSRRMIHIVDDDEAIRHSASFMLRNAGFQVQTHVHGVAFLKDVASVEAGCILLDVRMPELGGLEVQQELTKRAIDMPIIILTGHGDVSIAVEAMKAGAIDFIEKPYEKKALLKAIDAAFATIENKSGWLLRESEAKALISRLTERENDVLRRLVDGLTNKAIAEDLQISVRTVEIHRANMMEKLDADNLSTALKIAFAARLGEDG